MKTPFTIKNSEIITPFLRERGFRKVGSYDYGATSDHAIYIRSETEVQIIFSSHPADYPEHGIKAQIKEQGVLIFHKDYGWGKSGLESALKQFVSEIETSPLLEDTHNGKIGRLGALHREQRKQKDAKWLKEKLTTSRALMEDIGLPELGTLRARVHCYPSFQKGKIWDIRELIEDGDKKYQLYENTLQSRHEIAPGYAKVDLSSEEIFSIVQHIGQYVVSFEIQEPHKLGLDGTIFGVSIYSGFMMEKHFFWWEDLDGELLGLSIFLKEQIQLFWDRKHEMINPEGD